MKDVKNYVATQVFLYKVGEHITDGHLISAGYRFCDEKTTKNEEKT